MSSKKNKRIKIVLIIVFSILAFFVLYIFTFKVSRMIIEREGSSNSNLMGINTSGNENTIDREYKAKQAIESRKSALLRLKESKSIYISDKNVENIKITGETLEEFKRQFDVFVKLRDIEGDFNPENFGKTNNNITFETDFNYFKVKSPNKVEYYKVPVAIKENLQDEFKRMIYTSVDFITDANKLGSIRIYCGDKEKGIWPWNKKELIHKILYKREVGKIQPEKEFSKSKYNYTIKFEKSDMNITIQTMGKDFIKVTNGKNIAYYEVYQDLYNYLHDKVFN